MTNQTTVTKSDVESAETSTAIFDLFGGEQSRGGVSRTMKELNALGYTTGNIAKMLGRRYQHVRNVLKEAAKKGR